MSDGISAEGELTPLKRSETLSTQAARLVRSAIVSGILPAGSQLTVPDIARRCGVSATPAREALIRLSEAGLVTFHDRRITIASPSPESLREAFELREALEGMSARLAARRRSEAQLETIERLARESMEQAHGDSPDGFLKADSEFHLAIAEAAGSRQLQRYLRNALDLVNTLRNLGRSRKAHRAGAAHFHLDVADAIRAQDEDGAERAMRLHIQAVFDQFMSTNFGVHSELDNRSRDVP